jgi:hypothetical protein
MMQLLYPVHAHAKAAGYAGPHLLDLPPSCNAPKSRVTRGPEAAIRRTFSVRARTYVFTQQVVWY